MQTIIHTAAVVLTTAAVVVSPTPAEPVQNQVEMFPGVRVDRAARTVEFDGEVPIKADVGDDTVVFLEVMVCVRDTKEHEALVVTDVRPSHIHAALLTLGIEPGQPGGWREFGDSVRGFPPHGPGVVVEFIVDGVAHPAASWVARDDGPGRLEDQPWVFAGSRFVDRGQGEVYDADGTGVLIGLTTFGSEVLAYPTLYSHDSAIEEPVWIADMDATPELDTPVTVRLSLPEAAPADEE